MATSVLEVRHLTTRFPGEAGLLTAVDEVSFALEPGRTLAVVGESGSGKSVCALSVMGLVPPPGRVEAGQAMFEGRDLMKLSPRDWRGLRGNRMSMIFQDPLSALNPVLPLGVQVAEPLRVHRGLSVRQARMAAVELLARVRIPQPERRLDEYPHQFSGGMRQRAVIAMALACDPALILADEPTTALDVTIQAQILQLLRHIQQERGTAVLLITHDMGVVAEVAQDTMVMYASRVVERASTGALFAAPRHPYTVGLMGSVPRLDRPVAPLRAIPGQPPDLRSLPAGCAFAPRCRLAQACCREIRPSLVEVTPGHFSACHFPDQAAALAREELLEGSPAQDPAGNAA